MDTTKDEEDLDLLKGVLVVGTLIHKYYEIFGTTFFSFIIIIMISHLFFFVQRERSLRSRRL